MPLLTYGLAAAGRCGADAKYPMLCSVATSNFEAVEAKEQQGLSNVMAGVQDLNILFSNVAFVAILRGTVQVMEAGIEDPDMVFWLQVRLCCIICCRVPSVSVVPHAHQSSSPSCRRSLRQDACMTHMRCKQGRCLQAGF